jgi:hypothetical protein
MRVAGLFVYPVKSCRGIELERTTLTEAGLAWDRHWMIVRPDGRFVTQRELARLALIETALTAHALTLSAVATAPLVVPLASEGRRLEVTVWRDRVTGIDCGDSAARWLTELLAEPLRLVEFERAASRYSSQAYTGEVAAKTEFADGYALLIVSNASLADLNSRLPGAPLPMNRFRPNIVLDGVEAYAEDRMRDIDLGGARLRVVKPCTRCKITTTNQESAVVEGDEPLRTLKSYRFDRGLLGVAFGQNAIVLHGHGAELRVGMPVALAG